MSIIKRLPWLSLALVLLTYAILGWVISKASLPPFGWVIVAIAILLLLFGLTTPWRRIANYSTNFLKSNTRSFGAAVLAAFLFFLMIAWFRLFLDSLLIIAATILARIDFQRTGFNEGQTFCILSILSLVAVALGAVAQVNLTHILEIKHSLNI